MNHPKTGDEELAWPWNEFPEDRSTWEACVKSYRAHQSQTELLRKRVEKLSIALEDALRDLERDYFPEERSSIRRGRQALADDKASEGGV